jgi:hypothetical protein
MPLPTDPAPQNQTPQVPTKKIGLFWKLAYTAFVAVLVPFYLVSYGPTNFLYFCDTSLLLGMVALWLESPLLAAMPAVGILVPQIIWNIDFFGTLFGFHLLGMTDYMFDSNLPIILRGLSLFHGWLPFVLLWMVHRLGYDRRAWLSWTALGWVLLFVCYFFMPAPPAPLNNPNLPVNINYVYGIKDAAAQTWMSANAWFTMLVVGLPLVFWFPVHWILSKVMPAAPAA